MIMKKKKKRVMGRNGLQVGLLNVDGYYNSLLAFMDKAVDEGFVTPAARHIIVSAHTAQDLMCKLEVHNSYNSNNFYNNHLKVHSIHLYTLLYVHTWDNVVGPII